MTETLSLIGMSETPMVIYEAQRAGPSTGVPTYTAQSDLLFCTFAGHGDFPRVVVAPATPEEAYRLTRDSLNLSWKFQVPVLVLGDKHLGESYFLASIVRERVVEEPRLWDAELVKEMQDKRLKKGETLREYILSREDTVAVGGDLSSKRVLLTWKYDGRPFFRDELIASLRGI